MTILQGDHLPSCYLLAEQIEQGFAVVDNFSRIVHVNKAMADMLGYRIEEMMGQQLRNFIEDEKKFVEQGVPASTENYELNLKEKDGENFLATVSVGPIEYHDGASGMFILVSSPSDSAETNDLSSENLEKYQLIAESTSDVIFTLDMNMQMTFLSPSIYQMTNYTVEETLATNWEDSLTSDSVKKMITLFEDTFTRLRKGIVVDLPLIIDLELYHKKGHILVVEVTASPLYDDNGKPIGAIGSMRDISVRKETERALQESEAQYKALYDNLPDGLIRIDTDGKLTHCNDYIAELFGYAKEDIIGQQMEMFVHPDSLEDVRLKFVQSLVTESTLAEGFEAMGVRKDGSTLHFHLTSTIIQTEGGVIGIQSLLRNITNMKQMRDELREREVKYRNLLNNLPQRIFYKDVNSVYQTVNSAYANDLGLSPEFFVGKTDSDLFPEEQALRFYSSDKRVLESGQFEEYEGSYTFNNNTIEVHIVKAPARDDDDNIVGILGIFWDITERKKIDDALRESEERLQLALKGADLGVWDWKADLDEFLFDERYAGILGYRVEEMGTSYEDWEKLVHPDDIEIMEKIWRAHVDEETDFYSSEHRLIAKSGEYKWVLERGRVQERKEDGGTKRALGTILDITERKQVEEALRESEERHRTVIQSLQDLIFVIDENDCYSQFYSGNVGDLIVQPEQFIGKPLVEILSEDLSRVYKEKAVLVRKTGNSETFDYSLEIKGESERFSAILSMHEDGKSVVIVARNITARAKAEETVSRERESFRSIAEASIYATDVGNLCLRALTGLVDALGFDKGGVSLYDKKENILKTFGHVGFEKETLLDSIPVTDENIDRYLIVRVAKTLSPIFAPDVEADSSLGPLKKWLDILGIKSQMSWPMLDESGELLGVINIAGNTPKHIGEDAIAYFETLANIFARVLEKHLAEREVRRLNEHLSQIVDERTAELAAANRELEAFAYTVSHDLRAPLRTMDGFSQAVQEDYADSLDETGKDFLQRIRTAAIHMGKLIEDILTLSKVTRVNINRQDIDITKMVEEVIIELQDGEPEREVNIVIADCVTARGDPNLMRSVLYNLLGNAWKFTQLKDAARIEFGCVEKDEEIVYFIKDNGAGFDQTFADKLFKPFQRLHRTDEFEGTGIGLATVDRVIRKHGGRIWAEGTVKEGSTFFFTLT
ncbi:MAG: PAS domain S-box protein [Candidatus Thorarchaeota archaeon]